MQSLYFFSSHLLNLIRFGFASLRFAPLKICFLCIVLSTILNFYVNKIQIFLLPCTQTLLVNKCTETILHVSCKISAPWSIPQTSKRSHKNHNNSDNSRHRRCCRYRWLLLSSFDCWKIGSANCDENVCVRERVEDIANELNGWRMAIWVERFFLFGHYSHYFHYFICVQGRA